MVPSPALFSVVGLLAALSGLLIVSLMLLRRRDESRLVRQRLVQLQEKIEAALTDTGFEAERQAFGQVLHSASLTTELQRPRLETMAKLSKQPPEKYRILANLASQGLNVEEIAAVLGVSRAEAHQLLNLSSMAKCGQ